MFPFSPLFPFLFLSSSTTCFVLHGQIDERVQHAFRGSILFRDIPVTAFFLFGTIFPCCCGHLVFFCHRRLLYLSRLVDTCFLEPLTILYPHMQISIFLFVDVEGKTASLTSTVVLSKASRNVLDVHGHSTFPCVPIRIVLHFHQSRCVRREDETARPVCSLPCVLAHVVMQVPLLDTTKTHQGYLKPHVLVAVNEGLSNRIFGLSPRGRFIYVSVDHADGVC
mmetsp:Transcript_28762/g.73579  ORF Transcript_28762/g.73579 Transcript_28762/m.73579 type:complete len:223 (-) Transcript_28762:26-694(-)